MVEKGAKRDQQIRRIITAGQMLFKSMDWLFGPKQNHRIDA
jgi:hypothetical protein